MFLSSLEHYCVCLQQFYNTIVYAFIKLRHYCVCLQQFYNTIVYAFIKFGTLLCMLATISEQYCVFFHQV